MAPTTTTSRQVKDGSLTHADFAAANIDGVAGTASLRTLGTGAQQSCGGADARLSDARTPVGTALAHNSMWLGNASNLAAAVEVSPRVLLAAQVVSGAATVDFTSVITFAYRRYVIEFDDIVPGTNGVSLRMRVSTDNGSTWKSGATDYAYTTRFLSGGATAHSYAGSAGNSFWQITPGLLVTTANCTASGAVELYNPSKVAKFANFKSSFNINGTNVTGGESDGQYLTAGAIDAVRFLCSTGTVSGSFKLFGLK